MTAPSTLPTAAELMPIIAVAKQQRIATQIKAMREHLDKHRTWAETELKKLLDNMASEGRTSASILEPNAYAQRLNALYLLASDLGYVAEATEEAPFTRLTVSLPPHLAKSV